MTPVWSADGRSIAFVSVRDNTYGVYRRAADGSGAEERFYLHNDGGTIFLTDWSADGRLLTFWANERMYVMPLTGDRTLAELPNARGGRFSPDGQLLAFSGPRRSAGQVPRLCRAARSIVAGGVGGVAEGDAAPGVDRQRDRRPVLAPRRPRTGVHVAAAEAVDHGRGRDGHCVGYRVGNTACFVRVAARRRRSGAIEQRGDARRRALRVRGQCAAPIRSSTITTGHVGGRPRGILRFAVRTSSFLRCVIVGGAIPRATAPHEENQDANRDPVAEESAIKADSRPIAFIESWRWLRPCTTGTSVQVGRGDPAKDLVPDLYTIDIERRDLYRRVPSFASSSIRSSRYSRSTIASR